MGLIGIVRELFRPFIHAAPTVTDCRISEPFQTSETLIANNSEILNPLLIPRTKSARSRLLYRPEKCSATRSHSSVERGLHPVSFMPEIPREGTRCGETSEIVKSGSFLASQIRGAVPPYKEKFETIGSRRASSIWALLPKGHLSRMESASSRASRSDKGTPHPPPQTRQ